jgi:alkylresorcinol/alkylpyrone synthase
MAMPRIAAVSTANPPHIISQQAVKEFAQSVYSQNRLLTRLLPVFDNAAVQKRHLSVSLEWLSTKHSFTETNDLYIETALELSERVVSEVARQCGLTPKDFEVIFFISTTGISTPSIDARLFNRIGLSPHVKRIPIFGLGCAGGAGGLARAFDYLKAYPKHRALVVAVELCSLAFQIDDPTKTDIISAALFGDGAAACAIFGSEVPLNDSMRSHPALLGSLSTLYPDSLDVMSWRVTSEGFKVQLSKDIPSIVTSLVKGNIDEFLMEQKIQMNELTQFVLHPGGAKVLQAYADGLGVPLEKLEHSYGVLKDYGNMSSVTVYFVLKRSMESRQVKHREYGLVGALGPGFSSELVLLKWDSSS